MNSQPGTAWASPEDAEGLRSRVAAALREHCWPLDRPAVIDAVLEAIAGDGDGRWILARYEDICAVLTALYMNRVPLTNAEEAAVGRLDKIAGTP